MKAQVQVDAAAQAEHPELVPPTIEERNADIARQRRYAYKMQSDSLLMAGIRTLMESGALPKNEDIDAAIAKAAAIKQSMPYLTES
jgi:hypothetical protein